MIAFAMMAHWLACIWYVIGLSEVSENSTVSWLYALGEAINKPYVNFTMETGPDEGSAYVTALYFTLTSMTTVGFGNVAANTNGEKVFAVVTMLIGGKLLCVLSHLLSVIKDLKGNLLTSTTKVIYSNKCILKTVFFTEDRKLGISFQ